jgi:hypothetical protein
MGDGYLRVTQAQRRIPMQTDRELLLKILAAQVLIIDKLNYIDRNIDKKTTGSDLYGAIREIKQHTERITQEFNLNS